MYVDVIVDRSFLSLALRVAARFQAINAISMGLLRG